VCFLHNYIANFTGIVIIIIFISVLALIGLMAILMALFSFNRNNTEIINLTATA